MAAAPMMAGKEWDERLSRLWKKVAQLRPAQDRLPLDKSALFQMTDISYFTVNK